MIREVVDDRRMPPWHADPRYGHFANDRSLTARERATLLAWVDQGTPLGDPGEDPRRRRRSPRAGRSARPTSSSRSPSPTRSPRRAWSSTSDFRVPTGVQGGPVGPGRRGPARRPRGGPPHHRLRRRSHAAAGTAWASSATSCGYAPGDMPSVYPPGTAKKIPAGSDLALPDPLHARSARSAPTARRWA